jgi:hypothetical protein
MSNNDVTTRLTADNAQFDSAQKASGEAATASGRAIEAAAKKAAAAQAVAAKFAGDAVDEQSLRIVAALNVQKAANKDLAEVNKLVSKGFLDGAQASNTQAAALQRQAAASLALAEARKVEGAAAEHAAISQRMAASAAVRGLESGNVGIRSIENFITTIPGVGNALQALFPLLGAAGLAGLAFTAGEKLFEMGSKATHAGEQTALAFADIHDKAQVTIDDLVVTNDKLQDQIDKISGHPNNGLATALDEARKMADKLLDSLQADRKELEALLKEHEVGTFGALLSGVSGTGQQDTEILKDQASLTDAVRKANAEYNQALASTSNPSQIKAATDKRNAAVAAAFQSQIDTYARESKRLTDEQKQSEADAAAVIENSGGEVSTNSINNSAKIANIQGRLQQLQDALATERLNESIGSREATLGGLKGSKEGTDKAAEERMRAFESELAQMKINGSVSAKAEYDFWAQRISAFKAGSAQYLEVQRKEAELAVAGARSAHELLEKMKKEMGEQSSGSGSEAVARSIADFNKKITEADAQQDKARDARSDAANELAAIEQRNKASLEELQISEASGRTITKQAAAMQMAAVHTAEFGAEIERLNAKAAQIAGASYLTDAEKEKALGKIQIQGSTLDEQRSAQIMRDNNAINPGGGSALVGAEDALNSFTNSANDAARVMESIVTSTLGDVNKTLLNDITGTRKRGEWTATGHSIATSIAGGFLKKGEASALGAFGFGSANAPKGTSGDPMHVIVANLPIMSSPSMAGMSPQALGQALYPPASTNPTSAAGSLVAGLLKFIPGFADGGAVSAGTLAMVGERGPELAYFGSGGHVTPNHKLPTNMGSSDGGIHFHAGAIDARGSTDPAQTMALVQRGIMQAAPQIAAMAIKGGRDQNSRMYPGGRR